MRKDDRELPEGCLAISLMVAVSCVAGLVALFTRGVLVALIVTPLTLALSAALLVAVISTVTLVFSRPGGKS